MCTQCTWDTEVVFLQYWTCTLYMYFVLQHMKFVCYNNVPIICIPDIFLSHTPIHLTSGTYIYKLISYFSEKQLLCNYLAWKLMNFIFFRGKIITNSNEQKLICLCLHMKCTEYNVNNFINVTV